MGIAVQSLTLPWKPRNPFLTSTCSCSHLRQIKIVSFKSLYFSSSNLSHNLFFAKAKGCLSMSTNTVVTRPTRLSVICMARRYAPNTRKRKIKSRKRGGDPGKKRRRRKRGGDAGKKRRGRRKIPRRKKDKVKIVRLVSSAGTGYSYAKRKGKSSNRGKKFNEELEIKKYDPNVKCHVLFKESK